MWVLAGCTTSDVRNATQGQGPAGHQMLQASEACTITSAQCHVSGVTCVWSLACSGAPKQQSNWNPVCRVLSAYLCHTVAFVLRFLLHQMHQPIEGVGLQQHFFQAVRELHLGPCTYGDAMQAPTPESTRHYRVQVSATRHFAAHGQVLTRTGMCKRGCKLRLERHTKQRLTGWITTC